MKYFVFVLVVLALVNLAPAPYSSPNAGPGPLKKRHDSNNTVVRNDPNGGQGDSSCNYQYVNSNGQLVAGYGRIITNIPHQESLTQFSIYYGDGKGLYSENRIGPKVYEIDLEGQFDKISLPFTILTTQVPENAVDWLVFSANPLAESPIAASFPLILFERKGVNLTEGFITFTDNDNRFGWINGTIGVFINSTNNNNLTHFVAYFGNGNNLQSSKLSQDPIGVTQVNKNSNSNFFITQQPYQIPKNACCVLIFGRNIDVEGEIGLSGQLLNLQNNS